MCSTYFHPSCVNTNTETSYAIPVTVVISRQMISTRRCAFRNRRSVERPSTAISKLWQRKGYLGDFQESMEKPTMSAIMQPMPTSSMRKREYFVIFRWRTSQLKTFRLDMKSQKSVSRSDSVHPKYPILSPMPKENHLKHPIIEITHLSKKVGKSLLLDDLSLTIEKGEVFGFL